MDDACPKKKLSDEANKAKNLTDIKHLILGRFYTVGTVLTLLLTFNVNLLLCSTVMSAVTKRELMFPHRTAPKYVFDVFQLGLIIAGCMIYKVVELMGEAYHIIESKGKEPLGSR
jgi:hypothetical protein